MDFAGSGITPGQIVGVVVGIAIAFAIILRRSAQARTLRIELLWVRPVIFLAIIASAFLAAPPPLTLASLAIFALALAIGAALGWQRGRFTHIEVHPETHAITSRTSPWGILFIAAIVLVRVGLRGAIIQGYAPAGVPVAAITNALLLLFGATIIASSLEVWLRARRLLAEAQAARAGMISPGANSPIVR